MAEISSVRLHLLQLEPSASVTTFVARDITRQVQKKTFYRT